MAPYARCHLPRPQTTAPQPYACIVIRPLLVSHSDGGGGADRAAHRILDAVRSVGVDAQMWVALRQTLDPHVHAFKEMGITRSDLAEWLAHRVDADLLWLQKSSNSVHRSFNVVDSGLTDALLRSAHDVVHLHWLGSETASIREIGRIPGPVVWTMHDSWVFCGAEHHPEDANDHRFMQAYSSSSRRPGNSRVDLDAWTYRRKQRHFDKPRGLVGPSRWIIKQAEASSLVGEWPTSVIPNPIDVATFRPHDRSSSRQRWAGARDATVLLFGAVGGTAITAKGWDLLVEAVPHLTGTLDNKFEIWIFGSSAPVDSVGGIPVRGLGHINEANEMASLYAAADVHVIASRHESFSQTAAEAIACGTPVAAWSLGGLTDVVADGVTGILAQPFEPVGLARAIVDCLKLQESAKHLGPRRAQDLWSPSVVGTKYAEVYQAAIEWWVRNQA
jgi:glycosyltransferase involved in cell wall biosynthesis